MGKAKAKGNVAKNKPEPDANVKEPGRLRRKLAAKKENGKLAWLDELGQSLAQVGLRIRTVGADGNCFFRSCCDQMQAVEFMRKHPDDFSPYMEDDEDFDIYCNRMSKDGAWAGLHEQVAVTRLKGVVLCIHQAGQPCWTVRPDFPEIPKEARAWHLSYHGGEHYNSVRLASDYGEGPAEPIRMTEGKLAAQSGESAQSKREQQVDAVRWGTGCEDLAKIAAAIEKADGNVDQAIEALAEAMASEAAGTQQSRTEALHSGGIGSPRAQGYAASDIIEAAGANAPSQTDEEEGSDSEAKQNGLEADRGGKPGMRTRLRDRLPARGRACPCGSGRKYKHCCKAAKGAAARKQQAAEQNIPEKGTDLCKPISNLFI